MNRITLATAGRMDHRVAGADTLIPLRRLLQKSRQEMRWCRTRVIREGVVKRD